MKRATGLNGDSADPDIIHLNVRSMEGQRPTPIFATRINCHVPTLDGWQVGY